MNAGWPDRLDGRAETATMTAGRWVEWVRTAFETLRLSPPSVIRALALTQLATDVPWEMGALTALLDQLTEEYGLDAMTERGDDYVTIRLSRRDAGEPNGHHADGCRAKGTTPR